MIAIFVSFVFAHPALADDPKAKSCKQYVQEFYDWYAKRCRAEKKSEPSMDALANKKFSFSKQLQIQLKEDFDAAKHFPGEIVGLDFDPFLNAQDVGEKYTVEKVKNTGANYYADVAGTWNGKKNSKPEIEPELSYEEGHWVFVNFYYPNADIAVNRDLLSVLKQLKKDRPALPAKKNKR